MSKKKRIAQLEELNAALIGRVDAARRCADRYRKDAMEAEAKWEECDEQLKTWQDRATHAKHDAARVTSELQRLRTSLQRMEADLGKVRDAIGSDRWREIVGRETVQEAEKAC